MNPNDQPQIKLLGIPVVIAGPSAAFHIQAHGEKLQKRLLDCGCDIYPSGIRMSKDATAEKPEYDVIELSNSKCLINVETGLNWTPVPQNFALLTERSSSIEKLNGGRVIQGIIDAGYEGELIIRVEALTADVDEVIGGIEECIEKRLAIAQMITLQFLYPGFQQKTEGNIIIPNFPPGIGRGSNGFGSTDSPIIRP